MVKSCKSLVIFFITVATTVAQSVSAQQLPTQALPKNWQIGLPEPHSTTAVQMQNFHNNWLLWISILIAAVVLGLMLYAMIRFSARNNPVPRNFTHNTILELAWTIIPVLILFVIFFPSMALLKHTDTIPSSELTIKVTGNQWYWTYSYPDAGDLEIVSTLLSEDEARTQNKNWLLDTDNPLVLPVNTNIRFIITAGDVIHSWSVPALGVKIDAIPGRLNETWTNIDEPGVYYGFCTELCGANHSYMPVHLEALPPAEFESWLNEAKIANGIIDSAS